MAEKEAKKVKTAKKIKDTKKKKVTKKKEIKIVVKPKEKFFKSIVKELKTVKWPTFKEVLKYTLSTIVFCLIVCAFFILLNFVMSYIKGMFA